LGRRRLLRYPIFERRKNLGFYIKKNLGINWEKKKEGRPGENHLIVSRINKEKEYQKKKIGKRSGGTQRKLGNFFEEKKNSLEKKVPEKDSRGRVETKSDSSKRRKALWKPEIESPHRGEYWERGRGS